MMLIDSVTDPLKDGEWHYVRTLARKLNQPEVRISEILKFCSNFSIRTFDKKLNRVKMHETF